MRKQEFSKECKKRGFTQCGKSFLRVVGDGVFQHILLGFQERLDPSSPKYSKNHRYEPRILIYLKSMYARYDGRYINIDSTRGFSLNVPELLDKCDAPFMGAVSEKERMINEGLDVLDMITTQHQIIEYLEPLTGGKREGPQYSTQLYDIYLYCEEFYKARMAIETEFAENYFALMSNAKSAPDVFSDKMRSFIDGAESYYERYMLTAPVQYDAMKARLEHNYMVNFSRLTKLGILLDRKP